MSEIKMLPPPNWLLEGFTDPTIEKLTDYARAVAEHNVKERDAEIEALRAINDNREAIIATHAADTREYQKQIMHAEARAERLAEALRELKDLMLKQVKWAPCDCGCPQQRTPDGPHSVTWLRAAQQVEIAISKAEGKE